MKKLASMYVLLAAILWGSNGIFVNLLVSSGLNSYQRTSVRLIIALIIEFIIILVTNKQALKICVKDLIWAFLAGAIGIFLFVSTYTMCIDYIGMGSAAVLIYLMPMIVMMFGILFLKERLTINKALSALLSLTGCALVSGLVTNANFNLNGILIGIISAFCYATHNIIVATKLKKYPSLTKMFYPALFASVLGLIYLMIFSDMNQIVTIYMSQPKYLIINCLWAVVCSICTYYLFNTSLKYISISKASILSTFEPVAAVIFGIVLFREPIDLYGVIGVGCVLLSLILIELDSK